MIKVLNILTDSNIGGAGRCLINYLKYCDRDRFSVQVVLPRNSKLKPEVTALNVPVIEADGIAEKRGCCARKACCGSEENDAERTTGENH